MEWRSGAVPTVSPLGDGAIRRAPQRVAPAVAARGHLADLGLVDLDAKPRPHQAGDVASLIVEDGRVGEIVQQVGALVVVDRVSEITSMWRKTHDLVTLCITLRMILSP